MMMMLGSHQLTSCIGKFFDLFHIMMMHNVIIVIDRTASRVTQLVSLCVWLTDLMRLNPYASSLVSDHRSFSDTVIEADQSQKTSNT